MVLAALLMLAVLAPGSVVAAAPSAAPPALPWSTFSAAAQDSAGGQLALCATASGPQEVFVGRLLRDGVGHVFVFDPASGRILWVLDPKPDDRAAPPAWIGFGRVDPDKHDVIPPLRWERFDERKHADPCRLLLPDVRT